MKVGTARQRNTADVTGYIPLTASKTFLRILPLGHYLETRGLRSLMMNASGGPLGVLYVVVCAAPAASSADDFVSRALAEGWVVRVIATPTGERFIDAALLAAMTGDRVRTEFRMPDEPDELPKADAVVVAPATFNTINKWAAGVTDTFATGLLCELTGVGVPILAVPLLKAELARHLAFERSLETLRAMGVRVLFDPSAPPQSRMPSWPRVLEELHAVIEDLQTGRD
jgi:phosphopantothenoylcysteine synthetase/decarboxylase